MLAVRLSPIIFVNKRFDDVHDKLCVLCALAAKLNTGNIGLLELPSWILIHPPLTIVINSHDNHFFNIWITLDCRNDFPRMAAERLLAVKNILSVVKINDRIGLICVLAIVLWEQDANTAFLLSIRNHQLMCFHFKVKIGFIHFQKTFYFQNFYLLYHKLSKKVRNFLTF